MSDAIDNCETSAEMLAVFESELTEMIGGKNMRIFQSRADALITLHSQGSHGELFLCYLAVKLAARAEAIGESDVPPAPPTH